MGVYLDVATRYDRRSAESAIAEARQMWTRAGDDIGSGLAGAINKALGHIDGSGMRRSIIEMRAESNRLATDVIEAHRRMQRSIGDVETRTRALSEITQRYGEDSSKASAATVALADAHAIAARNAREHEKATAASSVAHAQLTQATRQTATSIGTMAAMANGVGIASIVGLTAAIGETTKAAAQFQDQGQKLASSADVSAADLKVLSDGILKLAGSTRYSAQEMMAASYDLVKMGDQYRNGANAVKMLGVATQLAAVESAPLESVIHALTITMNDYNVPVEKAADIASKLKVAVGDSGTNLNDFAGSLHSVEPVASAFGIQVEDIYTALARYTKTGTSADQATENLRNSLNALKDVQSPAAAEMRKFGIDADNVALNLKGVDQGGRGYIGTIKYLTDTVLDKFHGQTQISTDDLVHNTAALDNAKHAASEFQGPLKDIANGVLDGTMTIGDFRKAIKDLPADQAQLASGFMSDVKHIDEFSKQFKGGRQVIEDVSEVLKRITGTVANQSISEALFGDPEKAKATLDELYKLNKTTADTAGNVEGAAGAQQTLAAQMDHVKNAFGAAAIQIGQQFVPAMTDVAHVASQVGNFLAANPGLAQGAIHAMEDLGGAWLAWKVMSSQTVQAVTGGLRDVLGSTKSTQAETVTSVSQSQSLVQQSYGKSKTAAEQANTAMRAAGPAAKAGAAEVEVAAGQEVIAEDRVALAADRANRSLSMGKAGLVGLGATIGGDMIGGTWGDVISGAGSGAMLGSMFGPWGAAIGGIAGGAYGYLTSDGHAAGGPVYGNGPKGVDSVPSWLAPGEHVLTAADVDAMGGHAGVYAWRNALHRADGGAVDGDMSGFDAALLSYVPSGRYTQATADLTKGLADCSSAIEGLVNIMDGTYHAGREMSTANEAQWLTAHGFLPGIGGPGDFRVGFNSEHTQATLPGGTPFNWGSDAAAARRGIGGTGAYDPAFTQHYYRPVDPSGIPADARMGTNADGVAGYYTPDPKRVADLEDRLNRKEKALQLAEEHLATLKNTASQYERDRIQNEIDNDKKDLEKIKADLADAEQGKFHKMPRGYGGGARSGYGSGSGFGSGGMQFGAKLPENFGLGKGIPGFFEWLTTFAADMAIGPIEGALYGNYLRANGMGADSAGGYSDVAGDMGIPTTALASDYGSGGAYSPYPGNGGGYGGGGRSGSGGGTRSGSGAATPASTQSDSPAPDGGGVGAAATSWWGSITPAGPPVYGPPMPPSPPVDHGYNPTLKFGSDNPGVAIPRKADGSIDLDAIRNGKLGSLDGMTSPTVDPNQFYQHQYPRQIKASDAPGKDHWGNPVPDWNAWDNALVPAGRWLGDHTALGNWLTGQPVEHHADGGPVGTDTIPAWLSPGEFIVNSQATKANLHALQFMNAGHYDTGTQQPLQPGPGQGQTAKPGPAQPQGKPEPGPSGQPHLTGSVSPGPGNLAIPGGADTHAGLATPGGATEQFGQELPASSGIGFGGGLIGGAEQAAAGAASAAGGMFGGGGGAAAGMALNAAFQMMNRTAGYIGQLGGIAAEGVLSTLLPADSPLSNFSNSLPGKLIASVAGVRPGQPNSAGKTEAPMKTKGLDEKSHEGSQPSGDQVGMQINGGMHVHANNPGEFHQQMSRQFSAAQAAYPMNTP